MTLNPYFSILILIVIVIVILIVILILILGVHVSHSALFCVFSFLLLNADLLRGCELSGIAVRSECPLPMMRRVWALARAFTG